MFLTPYPLAEALAVPLIFGLTAYALRTVSRSGLAGGVLIGALVYGVSGVGGFAVLGVFFVLGSALTRLGYAVKAARGIAQSGGGRRGARHALANCAVGTLLAMLYKVSGGSPLIGALLTAAFSTAAADTAGTEFGSLFGRRAFLAVNLRPVAPGTPGAVSIEGTSASLAAAAIVALTGLVTGLFHGVALWAVVAGSAFAGAYLESLIGSYPSVERALGNEWLNVLNTATGALLCLAVIALFGLAG